MAFGVGFAYRGTIEQGVVGIDEVGIVVKGMGSEVGSAGRRRGMAKFVCEGGAAIGVGSVVIVLKLVGILIASVHIEVCGE